MSTIALEGTGAQILLAGYTADLLSLTLPDTAKDALDTSHLGTQVTTARKGTRLVDSGQVVVEFDHQPALPPLIARQPEIITIVYPLRPDQSTPDRLSFVGFCVSEGSAQATVGSRMVQKVTFAIAGGMTFLPGNPPVTNARVSPVLDRVYAETDGTFTALWGWYSQNTVPVVIPVAQNRFDPQPSNRGQPTMFTPGRQYGKFTVNWQSGNLVWVLTGPDGLTRTATASPGTAVPR